MSAHICNYGLFSIGMNSSKAAIVQMTRSLACEWGSYKIRVNTLSPGSIASPIPKERYEKDPESLKVIEQQNPLGRINSPDEQRGAVIDGGKISHLKLTIGHRAW
jgi:NAD(P)-dependent dehydrogenase (short-subunit alcohol dehydrogenase family)